MEFFYLQFFFEFYIAKVLHSLWDDLICVSSQQVVDEWIDAYKENRDASLLQLMQFFINAAGCKGKITPHMQATMEHAEIIRRMTEEFEEVY